MNSHVRRRWPLAAMLSLLLGVSGCMTLDDLMVRNFFGRDDPEDLARYGPTPGQRLAELAELRRTARSAERSKPEFRQALASRLAAELREEPDPLIRLEIVRTLAAYPSPPAHEAIRFAVSDENDRVRIAAIESLAATQDAATIGVLGEVLAGGDQLDVRLAAARGLGEFRDPRATPAAITALAAGLDDGNPALQHRVIRSLQKVSGRDYGADIDAWQRFAAGEPVPPPPAPSLVQQIQALIWR